jgi:hypothetical protein
MIQIVTGKLGAGKTLYTVMLMFEALCKGRIVVTNIAVDWPRIKALARRVRRVALRDEQLIRLDPGRDRNWHESIPWGLPHAPIEVYLDEIHLFFNARDWQKTSQENRGLLSFLTQSRKAGVNVTFIAQEINTVEKQFRVLAEWELYVVSSDHLPLGILGKSPVKFFIVAQRDSQNGNLLRKYYKGYDRRYFGLYGSYTFLDDEMNGLAAKAVRVAPVKLPRLSVLVWCWEWLRPVLLPFARLWRWANTPSAKPIKS